MRKVMPCKRCPDGEAKIGKIPYIMERNPAIFESAGARLHYTCSKCGSKNELSKFQFMSIPNKELTVAEPAL